ncbi:hypothetical protein [Longitalea luteola]|uniref:hypothetical protein n=1 Tax=Longitalea luteola TaxID=2812563 RepID=UPI001A962CFF|nr:hypothetical protein [Longitalea luteola]
MKRILFVLALLCLEKTLHAQTPYIYTIKADSVKITNTCDTAELIIENHTQHVPGFLFNKGRGRTEFRRPLSKVSDSIYLVGVDTLSLSGAWLQGGNTFGTTGFFGTRDNNHIDFYTDNTKRGRWTNTGNLLIGGDTDYGYNLAVNGTTYGQFYTNSTTPLGDRHSGALRLRWGGGQGTYLDFYYQGNAKLRAAIGTPSDYRPLYMYDEIGFSFMNTPYVAVGYEGHWSSRFSVANVRNSGWDAFTVRGITSDSTSDRDLTVNGVGNTLIGDGADNGKKLQVNGTSWFRDQLKVGNDNYAISLKPAYGNGYGTGIEASMLAFGSVTASVGVNKQNKGNIPANSLIIGGAAPGYWTTLVDYNGNPTIVSQGNGAVTINGGYNGINNGGSAGYSANAVSHSLNIYGGRGTGSGTPGDINFGTGNGQESGMTMHTMTTRWTIKGGTGFLANSPNPSSMLDITGTNGFSQLRLRTSYTPSSTSDTNGSVGDVSWDDNFFYIKTSNGWKRAALTTF